MTDPVERSRERALARLEQIATPQEEDTFDPHANPEDQDEQREYIAAQRDGTTWAALRTWEAQEILAEINQLRVLLTHDQETPNP